MTCRRQNKKQKKKTSKYDAALQRKPEAVFVVPFLLGQLKEIWITLTKIVDIRRGLATESRSCVFRSLFLGHFKEIWITLTNASSLRHGLELRRCQTTATRKVTIQDPTF